MKNFSNSNFKWDNTGVSTGKRENVFTEPLPSNGRRKNIQPILFFSKHGKSVNNSNSVIEYDDSDDYDADDKREKIGG
jgi:hypothetical protein